MKYHDLLREINFPDDIEIPSFRTENSKTYRTGRIINGEEEIRVAQGIGPVHYKENYNNPNEPWKDIDTDPVDMGDYLLVNKAPIIVKIFKDKTGYEVVSRKTGHKITVELDEVDNKKNSKHDNNEDLDLQIDIQSDRVRLWKHLKTNKAPKKFRWKITEENKTNRDGCLKFRENPEAFDINNLSDVLINTKKTKINDTSFYWEEEAPKTGIMVDTDVNYQTSASGDDYQFDTGTGFSSNSAVGSLGNWYGNYRSDGERFVNVQIPKNANITGAKISYLPNANKSGACPTIIYGNAVDNAVAPTSNAEAKGLALTTASVSWSIPDWTAGVWSDSPDISSIITEITSRANWAAGNALQIVHKQNNVTSPNVRDFKTYDFGSTSGPKLYVTYTAGAATNSITKAFQFTLKVVNNTISKAFGFKLKSSTIIVESFIFKLKAPTLITKACKFCLKSPVIIQKAFQFTLKTSQSIVKSYSFKIRVSVSAISKSFGFKIKSPVSIEKAYRFALKTVQVISKSFSFSVASSIYLDQHQDNEGASFGFGEFNGVRYRAQKFTPTYSDMLARIGFSRAKGSKGVKVYIDTVTNGQPTHDPVNALYAFKISNANLVNGYGVYDLPIPLQLTGDVEYCFYLAPWDVDGTDTYSDEYLDCHGVASGNSVITFADYWFTENLTFHYATYMSPSTTLVTEVVIKTFKFVIKSPSLIAKAFSFKLLKANVITKPFSFTIISLAVINKAFTFYFRKSSIITKAFLFVIKAPSLIVKGYQLTIKSGKTIDKTYSFHIGIVGQVTITKPFNFIFVLPSTINKQFKFCITSGYWIQKSYSFRLLGETMFENGDKLFTRKGDLYKTNSDSLYNRR
jgi:hypothetical protein